jgi:hypothetical protein
MFQVHLRFLNFIQQLFTSQGYEAIITHGPGDEGVDLVISNKDLNVVIEAKINRTKHRPPMTNALIQLNFAVNYKKAQNGILIITSIVEPTISKAYLDKYGVFVWDRSILLHLTKYNTELRRELEEILSELKQSGEEDIYEGVFDIENYETEDIWIKTTKVDLKSVPTTKGKDLYKELNAIPPGKDATNFEKKCEEILKYLFDIDLTGWNAQNSTDDALHRFDLIARIISQNDFWRFIARDFKTRYVIFEFKNYTDPIKQGQIYSTEKYLYTTALRSFAIIISRKGADKNATTAMKGSLRENGKLIICLSIIEICEMLKMKDNGDDPNTFLSEKIDKILMQLSR